MVEFANVFDTTQIKHTANQNRLQPCAYPQLLQETLGHSSIDCAITEITQWPNYEPTPLHALQDLAAAVGVGMIHYKDESHRFGLGSFKALGGAYSVLCLLQQQLSKRINHPVSFAEIRSGQYADIVESITVTTATDGNHGRSVAWGAQQFGCRCVIFIHAEVSEYRQQAMQAYGAEVIRIEGNYDESVHLAAQSAAENGWFVISDTSYEGYTEPPRNVMSGYCVMMKEVLDQLQGQPPLTHVFIQGGVGGLAAAVTAYLWQQLGQAMPKVVIVEPELADCLYQSAVNREPTIVEIQEETLMAGLSCGEVSMLGWKILEPGASDFLTINEDIVAASMQLLAQRSEPVVAGESAIAGLAALIACSKQRPMFELLELDASSQVLLLGTEGATDPMIYQQLIDSD